jgi:hypothetical protein
MMAAGFAAWRYDAANSRPGIAMAYKLGIPIDAANKVHCPVCEKHDRVKTFGAFFNPLIGSMPLTVVIDGNEVQARDYGVEWENPYLTALFKCDSCDIVFNGHVFFNDPEKPPVMIVATEDADPEQLDALIADD